MDNLVKGIGLPLTPTEEESKFYHGDHNWYNNYSLTIGNLDSTLGLQNGTETCLEQFDMDSDGWGYSEDRGKDGLYYLDDQDDLALIKSEAGTESQNEYDHQEQELESEMRISSIKENLNIMRDLSYGSCNRSFRGKKLKKKKKKRLQSGCKMSGYHPKDDIEHSVQTEHWDSSSLCISPKSITFSVPSTAETSFSFESMDYTQIKPTISSLTTPPATPVVNSSFDISEQQPQQQKQHPRTKRSDLLQLKNHTNIPLISSISEENELLVKFKFVYNRHRYANIINSNKSFATTLVLPKISNKLISLAEMKKKEVYKLKNPHQYLEHDSIKFNLNYVKTLSNSKKDRYYSRLNIFELSKILGLDDYDILLTKEIEMNVLEIFKEYCNFRVGYQTWIRDTTKDKRVELISLLHKYTSVYYPEFDKFKLEVIIRRGSYSLMQSRLRKERRSRG